MSIYIGLRRRILPLILCAAALLTGCGINSGPEQNTEDEKTFVPDSVQLSTAFSAAVVPVIDDSDEVSRLYELYGSAVMTEKAETPDGVHSYDLVFRDSSDGKTVSWTVCRDGSCRWGDDESFYTLDNGLDIYRQLDSVFDARADVESLARELYGLKAPYIGDSTACGSILSRLGIERAAGPYSIELKTDSEPYGIIVHLDTFAMPQSDLDSFMGSRGYLFLALVDNAAYFAWDCPGPSGLHRSSVYAAARDIKQYSESPERFYDLCMVAESLSQSEIHPADVAISSSEPGGYTMYGAPADTVDKLWAMVSAMVTSPAEAAPENESSLNLMFYDSRGELIKVYTVSDGYCRIDGSKDYLSVANGSFDLSRVKAVYEQSRQSADYEDGYYISSSVFSRS